MDASQHFDRLATRIRSGPDPYTRRQRRAALARDIKDLARTHCAQGTGVLNALLSHYFSQGPRTYSNLIRACRRYANAPHTPVWLRLRTLNLLAMLTRSDVPGTHQISDSYRRLALRLARQHRLEKEEAQLLNNWFFAAVRAGRLRKASRLRDQVETAIRSLSRSARRQDWYRELRGRHLTHVGALLFATAASRSDASKADRFYVRALTLERGDSPRANDR